MYRSVNRRDLGELDIPAVRGVGGSLIYFLDSKSELSQVWEIEFDETGASDATNTGLIAVDHISQSMHYEEMLTWLLFYTSLLNLKKIPPQDVADPGGLVKSQVIESDDGALRIILNGSQSHRTQSSRFLAEVFGSGGAAPGICDGGYFRDRIALKEQWRRALEDSGELLR